MQRTPSRGSGCPTPDVHRAIGRQVVVRLTATRWIGCHIRVVDFVVGTGWCKLRGGTVLIRIRPPVELMLMGRNLWHSESMLCLAALAAHGVGVAGPHQHPALQAFPACAWPAEGGVRGGSLSASNRRSCTGIEPPCFARSCSTPPFGNVYNPGVREPPPRYNYGDSS